MEEQILPFGFINNKEEKEITVDSIGDVWESI
jgi:hypothetical protein